MNFWKIGKKQAAQQLYVQYCMMFFILLSPECSYVSPLYMLGKITGPYFRKPWLLHTFKILKYYTVTTHKHTLRKNKLKTIQLYCYCFTPVEQVTIDFLIHKKLFGHFIPKIQNLKVLYCKFCLSNIQKLSSHTCIRIEFGNQVTTKHFKLKSFYPDMIILGPQLFQSRLIQLIWSLTANKTNKIAII